MLADAITALYYFYSLLFAVILIVLFWGIRTLYSAAATKDAHQLRKAKFILLFAVIALLCVVLVSFFVTGKFPGD